MPSITADHLAEAHRLGVEAAETAASWVADGNTSAKHIARVLAMFDEGDPAVDQYLPASPNLSGEWAGDPTPASLYEDITGRPYMDAEDEDDPAIDALADAWEKGVSETFGSACEAELREWLPGDDSTCGHCGRTWNSTLTPTPAARCPFEDEHEYADED